MIKVLEVSKNYGETKALEKVSFEISKGEVTGFLGPNGAGKSTLLRILSGTMTPGSGKVFIAGTDIAENPVLAKKSIGYLPENNPLYPDYTPRQYLTFIGRLKGISEVSDEVERVMRSVAILDKADTRIVRLSKGYKQRVGIAAALVGKPPILLLDEPTVGLDPNQIVEIRELIRELGKENTVILSTHIMQEVNSVCNKVIIIHKGKIRAVDSHEGLLDRLEGQNRIHLSLKGDVSKFAERLSTLSGVLKVVREKKDDQRTDFELTVRKDLELQPELARMVVQENCDLMRLDVETLSLEEVFLRLTNEQEAVS